MVSFLLRTPLRRHRHPHAASSTASSAAALMSDFASSTPATALSSETLSLSSFRMTADDAWSRASDLDVDDAGFYEEYHNPNTLDDQLGSRLRALQALMSKPGLSPSVRLFLETAYRQFERDSAKKQAVLPPYSEDSRPPYEG